MEPITQEKFDRLNIKDRLARLSSKLSGGVNGPYIHTKLGSHELFRRFHIIFGLFNSKIIGADLSNTSIEPVCSLTRNRFY